MGNTYEVKVWESAVASNHFYWLEIYRGESLLKALYKLWDDASLMAGDESNTWDGQVAFMALFAELIVRECASKVTRNEALNIFEHFGVEDIEQ